MSIDEYKARRAWEARMQGHISDGYHTHFVVGFPDAVSWHALLVHHNGNRIRLKAYPYMNRITQLTNNVQTYAGKMY